MQFASLQLLDAKEQTDRDARELREMRRDAHNFGFQKFAQLFPEYGLQELAHRVETEEELDEVMSGENSGVVRYEAPDEEVTPDRIDELLAQMMSDPTGSISGDEAGGWQ